MAQVFDRGLVLALKVGAIAVLSIAITGIAVWRWSIDYPHALAAPVVQPVPFSHKHHAGDDGIDCRYCHYSVENSASAGMPSSAVCMSCHSQLYKDAPMLAPVRESFASGRPLQWIRVHDLPDFVYFDHSAHVSHGVPCQSCHGRVDEMPLTAKEHSLEMQWCLGCHRAPQAELAESATVFSMQTRQPLSAPERNALAKFYRLPSRERLTDCSSCHR